MTFKNIPYKRFWHELGKDMPLDENGLLRDPDSEWFHYYFEEKVSTSDDLIKENCLLLLGEPGIGKTTELDRLISNETGKKHHTVSFILRSFESKSDFKQTVLNDSTVSQWIENSNEPLSIYLDGLDEALLEAKKISYGVIDVIKTLKKHGQVFLRITCRTSDLPNDFQDELTSLYTGDLIKTVELAPLRSEDVKLAAREHDLNDTDFFSAVYDKELGALASRPITLNMLIREYHDNGKISESINEVYEMGCLHLLEDTKDRKEAGFESKLTLSQRLVVAERIAAGLILCNFANLNTGSIQAITNIELLVDDIDTGVEIMSDTGEEINITQQKIEEVIHTSLFKPFGGGRYTLPHQTFAEYLTARYLMRNQFKITQIESILLHEDRVSKGVIPQLKEVSMWLALMNDEYFMKLIEVDPFLLLKSSIDINRKEKLEPLIRSLIGKISERNRAPSYHQYFKFLKNLEFEGIQTLLKTEFSRPDKGAHTKKVVLDIVDAIKINALASDLIKLALDPKEMLDLRAYALEVLSDLETDPSELGKLQPLLESTAENEYRLVSKAIKCLYPTLIQSKQITEILDRCGVLKDEILKNSTYHILKHSKSIDLVVLLDWAANNFPEKSFPNRDSADFFDNIILEGIKKINEGEIKKSLSRYIFKKIQKHYRLFDATLSEQSYAEFLEYPEARRKIVEKIVSMFSDEVNLEFAYKLRRYRQSLVVSEDFDWVLNHILNSKNEKEGKLWSEILSWTFNPDNVEHIDKILSNKKNNSIQDAFKHRLTPIDIHSEEGKKAREEHEEVWSNRNIKSRKEISPQQLIKLRLDELKKGDIDAFCELDLALSLEPEVQYYNKHLDFTVEKYPGWISADDELKKEILHHAEDYINEAEPADEDWINDFRSRSAFRAHRLLSIYRPGGYNNIPDSIWEKWLKPFLYFELSDGINTGQNLLKIYYQKFPEKVIDFIETLIRSENDKNNGLIFITRNIDSIIKGDLAESLYKLLDDDELKPKAKETIKEKLLEIGYLKVLEYIKVNLDRESEDEFVRDAHLISRYSPDDFFQLFWSEFETSSDLSHQIITKIALSERHQQELFQSLGEKQLAKLYIWLEKNYPAYKFTEGVRTVTNKMRISDYRRYALNNLVARGTEEACNQMLNVVAAFPNKQWLKISYEEAKEIYRRENWQPIEPENLLKLANDERSRIIRNEQDLLQIISEKLFEFEKILQDQEQSEAIVFWNDKPFFLPKDENFISDRIKNYLNEELLKKGIVLNREVEVQKGNKTDIHVTAFIPNQKKFSAIKLIIEIKGCWHKDLKTSFEKQLVKRYLKGKGINTGIYLVAWFLCDKWDNNEDYRYGDTPKFSIEEAKGFFEKQRIEITEKYPQTSLRDIVLNFTIT